jgi:hypothetical protein
MVMHLFFDDMIERSLYDIMQRLTKRNTYTGSGREEHDYAYEAKKDDIRYEIKARLRKRITDMASGISDELKKYEAYIRYYKSINI